MHACIMLKSRTRLGDILVAQPGLWNQVVGLREFDIHVRFRGWLTRWMARRGDQMMHVSRRKKRN